jgi:NADPH2:quinone reductase
MTERHIVEIEETGGPERLRYREDRLGDPGEGQVTIEQTAIGLNFIDTYQRSGLYPVSMPFVPGLEAAGTVAAVGRGVDHLKVGDRVVYLASGAYASHTNQPANRCIRLPGQIDDRAAAAVFLKGLTAWMLLFEIARCRAGQTALVWAPVGGVGSLLVPWATSLGVRVIGVTSSRVKIDAALAAGAEACLHTDEDVPSRVRELTGGRGADVSFDSVGKVSAQPSLSALRPRGLFVTYGNASGPVDPIPPQRLSQGGSLTMIRPTLFHYIAARADLERGAQALFGALRVGTLSAEIGQSYRLEDAAQAHEALEAKKTTGSTILMP